MKTYIIAYGTALVSFLVIDGLWLGVLARNFYAEQLSHLLRDKIWALPGLVFYLGYTAGIVVFAVRPHLTEVSLLSVACYGAGLGLLCYGTYNMTNMATLKQWPIPLSLVDVVWGACLSAMVASLSSLALRAWN